MPFKAEAIPLNPALIFDFDGTLVDLAPSPDAIKIPHELSGLISRLYAILDGAVAIITGRPVSEIEAFLELPDNMPVAGIHGGQWRGQTDEIPDELSQRLDQLQSAAEKAFGKTCVERKPLGLALHYRQAPQHQKAMTTFFDKHLRPDDGLKTIEGKSVIEAKPSWANKGAALQKLAATPPFQGRQLLVFGDDVTDEDAFAAALDLGGQAIKVGDGPTMAQSRLSSPHAVLDWLSKCEQKLSDG